MKETRDLETLSVNAIRFLAIDAVEKARSGHPGMPMGMAPLAYLLFREVMRHNPLDPDWPDRDRFVLSAGHGSMLLYAVLHLTGYDLPLEELKSFRQWGSKTPGHPERGHTPGVEVTTGPLGQGISTAVGLALAERKLAAEFNRPGHVVVDHYTYVLASDGDLMEGVSGEAASLAGHWGLSKLIVFWDDNRISIDGPTDLAFTEDVLARYRAYGWQTLRVEDVNDLGPSARPSSSPSWTSAPPSSPCGATSASAPPSRTPPRPTGSPWARRRWRPPGGTWAGPTRPSWCPRRSTATWTCGRRGGPGRRPGKRPSRPTPGRTRTSTRSSCGACEGASALARRAPIL